MPGVWMSSGSISPGSTRCSTSAIVSLPAVAIIGLKLRAVLRKDEVAFGVRLEGMDERNVGDEAALHHIGFAVEFARSLPSAMIVPTPVLV